MPETPTVERCRIDRYAGSFEQKPGSTGAAAAGRLSKSSYRDGDLLAVSYATLRRLIGTMNISGIVSCAVTPAPLPCCSNDIGSTP